MSSGKISFIVRKTSPDYSVCVEALQRLEVPVGLKTEVISIKASGSVSADRQLGMLQSQADYKVYLDDMAIILDEKFLLKITDYFQNNRNIGLLGVIGTNIVPTNGISLLSTNIQGEFYDKNGTKIAGNKIDGDFVEVKSVIGAVMATQYDIEWPVDYRGDYFYDTAISLEYQRQGYKCAVMHMDCPLVWEGYAKKGIIKKEQETFLDNYSSDLYPLVSVIIPSYQRPQYLAEAIESVLNQTYRNLDVFVSDRSGDMESELMVKERFSHDTRLHYVHHPNLDRKKFYDYNDAYNNTQAEYVNWLMDDDLFAPEKIARMMDIYRNNPDVSLVTSYRKCIDSKGNIIDDRPYTTPLSSEDFKISGRKMARAILLNQLNMIGELSTCLIKKKNLYNGHLGCFECDLINALSDATTWIQMCSLGNVVYLAEPLSYVRIHDGQDQLNPHVVIIGTIYWALLLNYDFHNTKFLQGKLEKNLAVKKWLRMAAGSAINTHECKKDSNYEMFEQIFSRVAQTIDGEKDMDLSLFYK